jgi:hypothetical protein
LVTLLLIVMMLIMLVMMNVVAVVFSRPMGRRDTGPTDAARLESGLC